MKGESKKQLRKLLAEKSSELRTLMEPGEQLDFHIYPEGWTAEVVDPQGRTVLELVE